VFFKQVRSSSLRRLEMKSRARSCRSIQKTVGLLLVTVVLWSAAPSLAVEPDGYEPDDTVAQARVIFLNYEENQLHNFHIAGDQDWVKFYGLAGITYEFGTEYVGSSYDAVMELYGTDGTTLLTKECVWNVPGEDCYFDYRFNAEGIYFLKITQKDPNDAGEDTDYELYVWDGGGGAHKGRVQGKITDASVPAVPVQAAIKCSGDRATTSLTLPDGSYALTGFAGDYTCSFNAAGYKPMVLGITIPELGGIERNISIVPGVDFVVTKVAGPKTGKRGKTISVTTIIKNQAKKTASCQVGLYLSRDTKITVKDRSLLPRPFKVSNLTGGATVRKTVTVTIPAELKPGTYYLGAIADVNNKVAELDEKNNAKSAKCPINIQ
jgi:hypothetical protein